MFADFIKDLSAIKILPFSALFSLVLVCVFLLYFFLVCTSTTAQAPDDLYQGYKTDRKIERLIKAEERQAKALEDILQAIKHTRCHQIIRD
jgi:hypothetical protein